MCSANIGNKTLTLDQSEDVTLLRAGLVNMIKKEFVDTRTRPPRSLKSRSHMLREFRQWLADRHTHETCLACLLRPPEHKLACGHMLCEECCVELGRSTRANPNMYELCECPICAFPCSFRVRVRPATAGLRVLAIDGGGIRAVIPITILCALQNAVGLDIPVQEFFDLSFGTSSGRQPRSRYRLR